jgi:hypothetical protein
MSKPSFRASRPPVYRPKASMPPYPHQPSPFDGPGSPLNEAPDARPRPMAKDNPKPAKTAVQPSLARPVASERGRLLAEGFARIGAARPVITAADADRATSFTNAVERGRQEAADDAARMQDFMNDADELQAMGFTALGGRTDED